MKRLILTICSVFVLVSTAAAVPTDVYYIDGPQDPLYVPQEVHELGEGNRLEFRDFGVFETKKRAARIAQNPKTLQRVHVPPKRTVKFKVGRLMKIKLQEGLERDKGTAGQPAQPPVTPSP